MISAWRKFAYCHIPKTAGRTVREVIKGHLSAMRRDHHRTFQQMFMVNPEAQDYFKFCFVRNPYDRFLSLYRYACAGCYFLPLDEFIERIDEFDIEWRVKRRQPLVWDVHFMPQVEFITVDGEIVADFIGRFENFEADFADVLSRLDIQCDEVPLVGGRSAVGKMEHLGGHYAQHYTEAARQYVEDRYAEDLKAFGYEFEEDV